MRIKNNIPAMNAGRNKSKVDSQLKKNLEKLSSGYRINRAADDAAGLAIAEKMNALISSLEQAVNNVNDGISLIQVGEGALQEVHTMLDRLAKLSAQSSNGIYSDDPDRTAMHRELLEISKDIGRIADTTNFNNIPLFQGIGLSEEGTTAYTVDTAILKLFVDPEPSAPVNSGKKLEQIIYTETVFNYDADSSQVGTANDFSTNEEYRKVAEDLQTTIVPQVVTSLVDKYSAFGYLSGSSIGIGLKLESNAGSNTLASVSLGTSCTTSGSITTTNHLTYSLTVNVAKIGDLSTEEGRSALEQTIAHEMIHALMDEATTVGMLGVSSSGQSANAAFPGWFVEGMAQTASGPGNWILSMLSSGSDTSAIQTALQNNKLGSDTSASEYGTGYLACMYLGYLASGVSVDFNNSTGAAAAITDGLNSILSQIIHGKSLQSVISEVTGGTYSTISAFENGFATDTNVQNFVSAMLPYVTTDADSDGNIAGGLITGDLANDNPVADTARSGVKLFALDTGNTQIKNTYPDSITVLSGGGATIDGVSPIISYPSDIFTVTGGTEGVDWMFDTATGTLKILTGTTLTISGGIKTDGIDYYGNIVIADDINADLTLSGVTIDTSKNPGSSAGITIGNGSNVTLNIAGDNTITGSGVCAGIQLTGNYIYGKDDATQAAEHATIKDSSVTINLNGNLTVNGGSDGHMGGAGIGAAWATDTSNSDITINGTGKLTANGGMGGAGIGGSEGGNIGNIAIDGSGLEIVALGGDHGAGIGGGGWVAVYSDGPQHVESITVTGDVDITTSSKGHGTGIGSGCHGSVGTITIGDDASGADNSKIKIDAKGGNDGAAIGGGWDSTMEKIVIYGGDITATAGNSGSGIGSGYDSEGGTIEIYGGTIVATGSTNASGIGSGMKGTIQSVTIYGGEITADGGWTNDGGNIGGYTDKANTTKADVIIDDPNGLSIKAGENGEGKYITTGSVDGQGNTLHALDMSYIAGLVADGDSHLNITSSGTDVTVLSFPLHNVMVTTSGGTTYAWSDLQHMSEDSAYIWMKAEDITLTFTDDDGTSGEVALKFFPDYGLWRVDVADLPAELPKEPGYIDSVAPQQPSWTNATGAIVIQAGAYENDRIYIPRFYFSRTALGLDDLNIATQSNAQESLGKVDDMVDRVSEIRAKYGALQNTLYHIGNHLGVSIENLTQTVSVIRDVDMAEEMMAYTKNNILLQSVQSMMAQANQVPQGVLQLLQ